MLLAQMCIWGIFQYMEYEMYMMNTTVKNGPE